MIRKNNLLLLTVCHLTDHTDLLLATVAQLHAGNTRVLSVEIMLPFLGRVPGEPGELEC